MTEMNEKQAEREAFEAWAKGEVDSLKKGNNGGYLYADATLAWKAWQASATLVPAAPVAQGLTDAEIDAVWCDLDARGSTLYEPHKWQREMRLRFARAILAQSAPRANQSGAAAEMVASQSAEPVALTVTDEAAMRVALRIIANLEDRSGVLDGIDDQIKQEIADEIAVTVKTQTFPPAATGAQGLTDAKRVAVILLEAWQKAEPGHTVSLYPESYKATFLDMARAILAQSAPRADHAGEGAEMVATGKQSLKVDPSASAGQAEPAFWLHAKEADFLRAGYQVCARVTALRKGGGKRVPFYAAPAPSAENPDCAVEAIQFALTADDGMAWLRLWNEGNFEACRREWPEAPEECYIGADPMLRAAPEPAPAPSASPAYKDSTPQLHVGDSSFEGWYQEYAARITGNPKQTARDAYAAGMGDPLVMAREGASPADQGEDARDKVITQMLDALVAARRLGVASVVQSKVDAAIDAAMSASKEQPDA